MKKFFLCIVVALAAMGANAQVTWNVRAGGGVLFESYHGYLDGVYGSGNVVVQANIPIISTTSLTISPSLNMEFSDYVNFNLPLHLGYKIPIAHKTIFFPKIGPMIGIGFETDYSYNPYFLFGPSAELALEIKHFVISLNGYYNAIQSGYYDMVGGLFATIGYKF